MRRIYGLAVVLGLVAASFSIALAQSGVRTAMQGESVAETVSVLDHIWLDAAFNHDAGTMKWLFADDFVEVHPGGEVVNGQSKSIRSSCPAIPRRSVDPDNIEVRYASADVAVLPTSPPFVRRRGIHTMAPTG